MRIAQAQLEQSPSLARSLTIGAGLFLVLHVAGSALSFAVHLTMARILGAVSYGHFVYALSWLSMLLVLASLGLKPTVLRFAATYQAHSEWQFLSGLLVAASGWTLLAALAVAALALLLLHLPAFSAQESTPMLRWMIGALPFVALSELWSAFTRGLGAVTRSQLAISFVQPALLGIGVLAIFAHGDHVESAARTGWAYTLATLGGAVVAGMLLYRSWPAPARLVHGSLRWRDWRGGAVSNLLIAALQSLRAPLVVVIAAAQVDALQLAYYGAAQRFAAIAGLGLFALSGFTAPLIARHYALRDFAALRRLARWTASGSAICAGAVTLTMLMAGDTLLELFGPGFGGAHAVLLILLLGEVIAACAGPVGFFMTMTGHERAALSIEGLTSVVVIIIAVLLTLSHGIAGAACAVCVGSALRNGIMALFVRSILKSSGP